MSKDLYFLRSSEQHILKDMVKIAHIPQGHDPATYTQFYGLTTKDLGLYALVNNELAGAVWSRELDSQKQPRICLAIVEKFKDEGIASFMMEQFLQEAGAIYESISIDVSAKTHTCAFYEKLGFYRQSKENFIMIKILQKKEVFRPSDGYDPSRWID